MEKREAEIQEREAKMRADYEDYVLKREADAERK